MRKLRILTLNLHCLEEENIAENQKSIVDEIIKWDIDLILLQEVAQYIDSKVLYENIKESNYGFQLQQLLKEQGYDYFFYFESIKHSFGKYDEGVAILSKHILTDVKGNYISKYQDYHSWKTRKMLKGDIVHSTKDISLVSVHLGWSDENEKFEDQVERLLSHLDGNNILILAGDFNVPPSSTEYTYLLNRGLVDLYGLDSKYLNDPTHEKDMDLHKGQTRIDYVFSNRMLKVLDRNILFKEKNVSDHFGVYIEIEL